MEYFGTAGYGQYGSAPDRQSIFYETNSDPKQESQAPHVHVHHGITCFSKYGFYARKGFDQ